MGSQPRLFEIFGPAWGWPPATMTREQDLDDLVRHADEMVRHESFNYAIFDRDETALLGCIYVDPPAKVGRRRRDLVVGRRRRGGRRARGGAAREVPAWIAGVWPFDAPRFIGEELTWAEWLALPSRRRSRYRRRGLIGALKSAGSERQSADSTST